MTDLRDPRAVIPITRVTAMAEETEALGRRIGGVAEAGDIIALVGDLGSGKTVFVRGLAAGLGVAPEEVASPSFTMVAEYRGRVPLFHIDLYRLEPSAIDLWALREYLHGPGVAAIEWSERLPSAALDGSLLVRIDYVGAGRRITFEAHGARAAALAETLGAS